MAFCGLRNKDEIRIFSLSFLVFLFYWLAGLSLLINWLVVQYDVESQRFDFPLKDAMSVMLKTGPSSSLLRIGFWLADISDPLAGWVVGILAYFMLATIMVSIWRETLAGSPSALRGAGHDASTRQIKAR